MNDTSSTVLKRPSPLCDVDNKEPKKLKASFGSAEKLSKLGPQWLTFYETQLAQAGLEDQIYKIMALISTVGCPLVLVDVAASYQENSFKELQQSAVNVEPYGLYQTYILYEKATSNFRLWKHAVSVQLYMNFENFLAARKDEKRKKKKPHGISAGTRADNAKPETLALDDLVASCLGVDSETIQGRKGNYQSDRRRLMHIKNTGHNICRFRNAVTRGLDGLKIWTLLPLKAVPSYLDEEYEVGPEEYAKRETTIKKNN